MSLPSCVTLGKSLNLSESELALCANWGISAPVSQGLCAGERRKSSEVCSPVPGTQQGLRSCGASSVSAIPHKQRPSEREVRAAQAQSLDNLLMPLLAGNYRCHLLLCVVLEVPPGHPVYCCCWLHDLCILS